MKSPSIFQMRMKPAEIASEPPPDQYQQHVGVFSTKLAYIFVCCQLITLMRPHVPYLA